MRSVLAIVLLLVSGLPAFAPLMVLRAGNDAGLPACCRRAGAHHCGMPTAATPGMHLQARPQPCPYSSHALLTAQHAPAAPSRAASIYAGLVSHPACAAQTLARYRAAQDRARQKRGPPARA